MGIDTNTYNISGLNKSFNCSEDKTILEGALENSIDEIPFDCMNGTCNSCEVLLVEGSVTLDGKVKVNHEDVAKIKSCISKPSSDCSIVMENLTHYDIPAKIDTACKISSKEYLNENYLRIIFRFPPNLQFRYKPGQYITLSNNLFKRSYSIHKFDSNNNQLTLLIKNVEGGVASSYLFSDSKINDLNRISGPHGTFFVRTQSENNNIIFLANGVGISPIIDMINSLPKTFFKSKTISLYWGVRHDTDIIFNLEKILPNEINIFYCLSKGSEDKSNKLMGYVQDRAIQQFNSDTPTEVYACGSSGMAESSRKLFQRAGLNQKYFYSDIFY